MIFSLQIDRRNLSLSPWPQDHNMCNSTKIITNNTMHNSSNNCITNRPSTPRPPITHRYKGSRRRVHIPRGVLPPTFGTRMGTITPTISTTNNTYIINKACNNTLSLNNNHNNIVRPLGLRFHPLASPRRVTIWMLQRPLTETQVVSSAASILVRPLLPPRTVEVFHHTPNPLITSWLPHQIALKILHQLPYLPRRVNPCCQTWKMNLRTLLPTYLMILQIGLNNC